MNQLISQFVGDVSNEMPVIEKGYGQLLFDNGSCQVLSRSAAQSDFIIYDDKLNTARQVLLEIDETNQINPYIDKELADWDRYTYCALLQLEKETKALESEPHLDHKQYTRDGMVRRVLDERRQKSNKAEYKITWADNIYGDHVLINEKGIRYKIFLRDFESETGYSNSQDARINKLGTTKHIMYAFQKLKDDQKFFNKLSKTYPFVEIYLDPLNDYKITWHFPHPLNQGTQILIEKYFGDKKYIEPQNYKHFVGFLREANQYPEIVIRPEVREKIEQTFENDMLEHLSQTEKLDFSPIKAELFPYQKEGIKFATFKRGAIIADEMGLGKTIQAFSSAIMKKQILGFQHTLIVCPASLKSQWKKEIEKFSTEEAEIIEGKPEERAERYQKSDCFFLIVNYETVLRDHHAINKAEIDFLILDEAQRVKNYATLTASAIKNLERKHILVITGTPIENRLIDIFSIMSIIDPHFLGPLWEFSYQHCLFDPEKYNKINGYYNLDQLRETLKKVLLRREKREVMQQLPNIQENTISVELSDYQKELHASYSRGLSRIIRKRFLTQFDMQRIMLLLANMRMVSDSSYLVDEESNDSPKMDELAYMLTDKLDIKNTKHKIIIFSEWVKIHKLIKQVLIKNDVKFVELNGTIPVKHRGELIQKFEQDPDCKIFLSTEAGGSGLNLQAADILINFELPWNPAKKNQRIGRIDRLGQKSNNLTIYNFISRNSIEEQIAAGLIVKQNLFEGVLDEKSSNNFVDFSSKGRSQFIDQLKQAMEGFDAPVEEKDELETEPIHEETEDNLQLEPELENNEREAVTKEAQTTPENPEEIVDQPVNSQENAEPIPDNEPASSEPPTEQEPSPAKQYEQVLNSGLDFLSNLMKMSTGKDMGIEGKSVEVDEESGEVTMKFTMPKF